MKKFILFSICALCLGLSMFAFSACGKSSCKVIFAETTGESVCESIDVKESSKFELPCEPKKKGYEFKGWYFDKKLTQVASLNSILKQGLKKDITLYAKWELKKFSIAYYLYDGTNSLLNVQSYNIETLFTLANPTKNNFSFKGWYTDPSFKEENKITEITYKETEEVDGNYSLYAKWVPIKQCGIVFNANGGTIGTENIVIMYASSELNTITPPTWEGRTFTGWYTASENGINIIDLEGELIANVNGFSNSLSEWINMADVTTLYAGWNLNTHSVSFNKGAEDASGVIDNQIFDYAVPEVLTANTFVRKGYTFDGWTSSDNKTYADNESIAIVSDVVLTAKWKADNYSIAYELNGGTNNADNPGSYNISQELITLLAPTLSGYDFCGWFTEENFIEESKLPTIDTSKCANVKVFARWLKSYSITYELYGGINNANNPISYNREISGNITILDATRAGYDFAGWYNEAAFTNEITTIYSGTEGNRTVFAKWLEAYTIEYVIPETITNNNPKTYNTETTYVLKGIENKGYTFEGWYTDSALTTKKENIVAGETGALTLYPKWTPITYSISYEVDSTVVNSSNSVTYTIETAVTFVDPTKTGYKFIGWFCDEEYTTQTTGIVLGSTGNVSVYAKWEEINYKINYVLNEGLEAPEKQSYTINDGKIVLADILREGYDFCGWFEDADCTQNKVTEIDSSVCKDITLYAKWVAKI